MYQIFLVLKTIMYQRDNLSVHFEVCHEKFMTNVKIGLMTLQSSCVVGRLFDMCHGRQEVHFGNYLRGAASTRLPISYRMPVWGQNFFRNMVLEHVEVTEN